MQLKIDSKFIDFKHFLDEALFTEANHVLESISTKDLSENENFIYIIYKGMVLYEIGDFEEARKWLNNKFTNSFIENNKELFFTCLIYQAMVMIRTSELDNAINFLNTFLPDIIELRNDSLESLIYNWLGNAYWLRGTLQESLDYYELALKIRRIQDKKLDIATSLNNIANIYRVQGMLKKSIAILNEASELDVNSLKIRSYILLNRGLAYFDLGEYQKARIDFINSYNLRKSSGSYYLISDSIFNIIRSAYVLKDVDLLLEYSQYLDELTNYPAIKSIKLMVSAYSKMLSDPKSSLEDWNEALKDESLEFGYKLFCYEELLSIYSTQNSFKHENVLALLDNFEKMSKDNNLFASLPKIYFVRALIYKNLFEIQKAEKYLNDVISISLVHGLPFHENLARIELKNLKEQMEKFNLIYQHQSDDEVELDYENVISYIQNFKSILSEKFET